MAVTQGMVVTENGFLLCFSFARSRLSPGLSLKVSASGLPDSRGPSFSQLLMSSSKPVASRPAAKRQGGSDELPQPGKQCFHERGKMGEKKKWASLSVRDAGATVKRGAAGRLFWFGWGVKTGKVKLLPDIS